MKAFFAKLRKSSGLKRRADRGVALVELLMVVVIALILTAVAVPSFESMRRNARIAGDIRNIAGIVLLAKMRSAASFSQSRIYFDVAGETFKLQLWQKPAPGSSNGSWADEGGAQPLSGGVSLGYGSLSSPPTGTQSTIGQATSCLNDTGAVPGTGSAISDTACVVFNSRGIPIVPATGVPTADHAVYIADTTAAFGVTISATGLVRSWRSPIDTAAWEAR